MAGRMITSRVTRRPGRPLSALAQFPPAGRDLVGQSLEGRGGAQDTLGRVGVILYSRFPFMAHHQYRATSVFDDEIGDTAHEIATQSLGRVGRAQRHHVVLPLTDLGHDLLSHGAVTETDPRLDTQAAQRIAAGLQVAPLGRVGLE